MGGHQQGGHQQADPTERGRQNTGGWSTPLSPRRERGAKAPEVPEDETPVAQEGDETGEMEVEEGFESASEEMEEYGAEGD